MAEAFHLCDGLIGNLIIPNSVEGIGGWAFYGCSGFTGSLVIGDSITYIGWSAFERLGCQNIHLKSSWGFDVFTTWWNDGSPSSNLILGDKTWTSGHVYVDDVQITW
jgi:hypothetical protein